MRIVGEPQKARSVAMLTSLTSTSLTSAATPSELRTSLTNFTAAGWDGQSATYKTSTFIDDLPFFAHPHPARSGNARFVCVALCRNYATPTAVRIPTFSGFPAFAAHQRASLAGEGARAHTAASGFRANSEVLEFR